MNASPPSRMVITRLSEGGWMGARQTRVHARGTWAWSSQILFLRLEIQVVGFSM